MIEQAEEWSLPALLVSADWEISRNIAFDIPKDHAKET